MTDDTKLREIRERLNAIAPYPEHGNVTANGLARYLAVKAQVTYVTSLDPAADHPDMQVIARMVAEFAAAHALYALADAGNDMHAVTAANLVASQIWEAWEDGGSIGEWLWVHLGEETCNAVSALAGELSAAQAAVEAAGEASHA